MTRALMAGLTQEGCAYPEQGRLRRTVRRVAVIAVFRDRLMFPQKRAAQLGMTGSAGLVDGTLHELRRARRAVRRMAGSAGHLALAQWMVRRLEKIGALRLMTARADIDLGGRRQYRILGRVQPVTARASHIAGRVGTPRPVMGSVQFMATQTLRVLASRRGQRLRAKIEHARQRTAIRPHMGAARPVAGLAL